MLHGLRWCGCEQASSTSSKIVIHNFLLACLLQLVQLLHQICDVILNLEGLCPLQVLRLIRLEQHRVLLLRTEVEQELHPCLLQLAALKLDVFVGVDLRDGGLALEYGAFTFDLFNVDHFEFDGLRRFVIVLVVGVAVFAAGRACTVCREFLLRV